ncbi:MAG: type III pantothenate kinase, partial [Bilophila sp.]
MHALLIDIGNTSLKIGLSAPDAVIASYTLPTDIKQSGDSLGFQLACLLGHA